MGLIEAIIIGIQFKRLEKPIVFTSMLVCFLAFILLGGAILVAGFETLLKSGSLISALGMASFSIIFFGLSGVCGYFIKRCVS